MNMAYHSSEPAILIDQKNGVFKVARRNFIDQEILQLERERIFERNWIYLGHSSEIKNPGVLVTRPGAGRSILFARDAKGAPVALLNTCPPHGMQVFGQKKGSPE